MNYFYENELRLRAVCLLHGIDQIVVSFDGSGDSGSINEISVYKNGTPFTDDPSLTVFVAGNTVFNTETNRWEEEPVSEEILPLSRFLEQHVYEALEETEIDWYNDDGGYGEWTWDVSSGVTFEVNVRHVESTREHYEERELGVSDEEEEAAL